MSSEYVLWHQAPTEWYKEMDQPKQHILFLKDVRDSRLSKTPFAMEAALCHIHVVFKYSAKTTYSHQIKLKV